jgi:integrase/recombinase XerD
VSNYKYTGEIEKKLKCFDKYLESEQYAVDTIRQTRNYAGVYLRWLEAIEMTVEEVDYKRFIDFVFQLKKENTANLTKRIILAVKHYYNHLDIDINPASGIHIRGQRNSILNDIVSYTDIIELYNTYQTLSDRSKRNKVILGLIIYQGITTGELHQLEPNHIKLKEGKIYILGSGNTKSRTLELEAIQLLELQEYLLVIRPRMLENITADRSGRKMNKINPIVYDKMFFSENGNKNIKPSLYHLFRSIKKNYPRIKSGKVIRSTVIAEWLKTRDVRVVQHMSGHKWVSSTEKYNVYNLKELKESLEKHHPLK